MRKEVTFHLFFYLSCHSVPIEKTMGEGPAARVLKPGQFSIISLLKLSSHLLFLAPHPQISFLLLKGKFAFLQGKKDGTLQISFAI